ncbi:MAG: hypothetical protein WA633_07340, partial [Stellaceae bacterium]
MAVREIPTAGNDSNTFGIFDFRELSRTFIVSAQMVGDGLILTTLSYISFNISIYPHYDGKYLDYLPYFFSTLGTTLIVIFGSARSGVYDDFDEFDSVRILSSTVKCLTVVILLLTACLFIIKVSDNVSRLWLATWTITSVIALPGFRLLTASVARRLKCSGRLTRNVAIVGASEVGQQLAAKLVRERLGTRLVGIFDERRSRFVRSSDAGTKVHQLPALYELLCRGRVDEVVIAIPPYAS